MSSVFNTVLFLQPISKQPTIAPKPLAFDFELPASAATTTTSSSDPFHPSQVCSTLTVRSRVLGNVQSHSQNDVAATPSADTSKFPHMLGRASARVNENSCKWMRVAQSACTLQLPLKGKECVHAAAGMCSLDESDKLYDHTNLIEAFQSEHHASTGGAHTRVCPSCHQALSVASEVVSDAVLTDTDEDDLLTTNVDPDAAAGAVDITGGTLTQARNVTQHVPPRSLMSYIASLDDNSEDEDT